jgi:hypothetical protein
MPSWFTLSEVVAKTGAKRRAVQLWADGGVIESTPETDRAGTGIHRSYRECEVQIAAMLVPLANMGVPIGVLRQIAGMIRPYVMVAPYFEPGEQFDTFTGKLQPGSRILARAIKRAVDGAGENFLCLAYANEYLWVDIKTDEQGPACINPRRDFPDVPVRARPVVVVLDLTGLLHGLLD